MSEWASLRARVAGKWQLPLLALSLILLAGGIYRIRPTPVRYSPAEAAEHLDFLLSAGMYGRALDDGTRFLTGGVHTDVECAPIHRSLARALFREAEQNRVRSVQVAEQIHEYYDKATLHGQALTADDHQIVGRGWEWRRRYARAVEQYDTALAQGVENPLDLRRHVISLRLHHAEMPSENMAQQVDDFLADVGDDRLDLRLWAIERSIRLSAETGTLEQAATLLAKHHDRFEASDLRDEFSYLEAWQFYHVGQYDSAEVSLRTVRNRVEPDQEIYAKTGWLLGQVVLRDAGPKRPQEALSFFSDVLKYHSEGPYALASRVGSAEALVMLERHEEALDAYYVAIGELQTVGDSDAVNQEVLRTSLGVLAEAQRQQGQLRRAVEYAGLAVALVDYKSVEKATLFLEHLGQLQYLLAEEVDAAGRTTPTLVGRPISGVGCELACV